MTESLHGKVALVTGATSGIGRVVAEEIARAGAEVSLLARTAEKGARAEMEIRAAASNPDVEYIVADLSLQADVRAAAREVVERYGRLDILVNAAATTLPERSVTREGHEVVFATNHLGPFLLTNLLLPTMIASAPARVVNVASEAARPMDLEDVEMERGFHPSLAYGRSKMATILFTKELARRLEGTGVTANCVHPGLVRTGLGHDLHGVEGMGWRVVREFGRSPEKGADTVVWAAIDPEAAGLNGHYLHDRRDVRPLAAYPEVEAERLWAISERLVGLAPVLTTT